MYIQLQRFRRRWTCCRPAAAAGRTNGKKMENSSWFTHDHVARGSSSRRAVLAAARPTHFPNGLGCIVHMCV